MLHVRVSDDLKSRLERAAKESGRSMNAEIVQRLEASLQSAEPWLSDKDREILHRTATQNSWKEGLRELLNALDEKPTKQPGD
ncbi:Arc family DNA-binding protein [Gluconobacter kondonii]|nr:Arc family DNA-binding protein [Gluconobacter kondonii]